MNPDVLRTLVSEWEQGDWLPAADCPVCAEIRVSTQEGLPRYRKLFKLRVRVDGSSRVWQCPHCGQFYEFTSWMERPDWGECMEGVTEPYEVYGFYKRSPQDILAWLERAWKANPGELRVISDPAPPVAAEAGIRCPVCGSADVEMDGFYEFTAYLCRTCGNADTLDDWQRDEWRG